MQTLRQANQSWGKNIKRTAIQSNGKITSLSREVEKSNPETSNHYAAGTVQCWAMPGALTTLPPSLPQHHSLPPSLHLCPSAGPWSVLSSGSHNVTPAPLQHPMNDCTGLNTDHTLPFLISLSRYKNDDSLCVLQCQEQMKASFVLGYNYEESLCQIKLLKCSSLLVFPLNNPWWL